MLTPLAFCTGGMTECCRQLVIGLNWLFMIHFVQHQLENSTMSFSSGVLPMRFGSTRAAANTVALQTTAEVLGVQFCSRVNTEETWWSGPVEPS